MITHFDPSIHTLSHAIRALYSIPSPRLVYRQHVNIQNIAADIAYSAFVTYTPNHGTLQLTFPHECESITNIKNNHGERMVYYETVAGFVREVQITPETVISVRPDTKIIVYHTKQTQDLEVSFRMYLVKPNFRSKL